MFPVHDSVIHDVLFADTTFVERLTGFFLSPFGAPIGVMLVATFAGLVAAAVANHRANRG